jgi:tetratricopeptide (TPR) repeat protein
MSLKLRPQNIDTLEDKAAAHLAISEYEEADKCYDEILDIDPNYADAIGDKGIVQFQKGNDKEAISFFDRALAIEPDNTRI